MEYQNGLRDKYFPQIPYVDTYEYCHDSYHFVRGPYKEVLFESLDEAIEGSKYNAFDTDVTYKGIDLSPDQSQIPLCGWLMKPGIVVSGSASSITRQLMSTEPDTRTRTNLSNQ